MSIVKAEFVDLQHVHPFVKWAGGKSQLLSELVYVTGISKSF
ncbi:MAG TPA: hypothetical protein VEL11_04725 [Candidatus Bathyarchaeia archaeon]|nr:hypothetical protein [Candidatus Bathyarchaeia archaeon]